MERQRNKINWLLILQAWTMLWVVIGHAPLMTVADPDYAMAFYHVAYSFHMPLFIVISGYLFYMTRLGGAVRWTWIAIMKDKLMRLGIPFVVFTIIAMVVKAMFPGDMARQSSITITEFVKAVLYPGDGPLGELWFIAVIMWGFLLTPIWRKILSVGLVAETITLIFLVFLNLRAKLGANDDIHLFCISTMLNMMMWFYIGIFVCKYVQVERLCKSMKGWLALLIAVCILYVISMCLHVSIMATIFAILFSLSLAMVLEMILPNVFSSFRNYTYQIFLIGIFAQIAFKMIYRRVEMPYIFFYVVCIIMGLYIPVIVSKICEKINWSPILLCIGLKKK